MVALANDPARARWNQKSVSSGQLATEYGFRDLDGSQPDIWRFIEEIRERTRRKSRRLSVTRTGPAAVKWFQGRATLGPIVAVRVAYSATVIASPMPGYLRS